MKRSIRKPLNNTLNPSIGNISLCIFVILRYVTYAYIYDKHKTYKQIPELQAETGNKKISYFL